MQVFNYEIISSTSDEAAALLKQNIPCPFAVVAKKQTDGRGRRGRNWESSGKKGEVNICLTLAVAATSVPQKYSTLIPLIAARILNDWLQQEFQISSHIKWPNDLYLFGKKIAGIICESSIQEDKQGPYLIGLGVNLFLPRDNDSLYAGAISEYKEIHKTYLEYAKSFITFWHENFPKTLNSKFLHRDLYHIHTNELWIDPDQNQYQITQGIELNGNLIIQNLSLNAAAKINTINSVNHNLHWAFQTTEGAPLLMLDLGNSRHKILFYKSSLDQDPFMLIAFDANQLEDQDHVEHTIMQLKKHLPKDSHYLIFSFDPESKLHENFKRALEKANLLFIQKPKKRVLSWGEYSLTQLGCDRLALIEGWLTGKTPITQKGEKNCLGVLWDFGTAITVDFVWNDGEHLGGLIAPGDHFCRNALKDLIERNSVNNLNQERLKETNFKPNNISLNLLSAQNTEDAITTACILMSLAFYREVRKIVEDEIRNEVLIDEVVAGAGFSFQLPGKPTNRKMVLPARGYKSMIIN